MPKPPPKLLALVALSLTALAGPTWADDLASKVPSSAPPVIRAAAAACNSDAQKFCPDVRPGGGRIAMCLSQHTAELTPDCRAAIDQVRAATGR